MSKNSSQSGTPATGKVTIPQNSWTRRERPCDACRRRKSRCIISDACDACVLCQSRSEECTFIQSPLRRKRPKVEPTDESGPDTKRVKSPEPELSKVEKKQPISDYDNFQEPTLLKHTLGLQNRQHGQILAYTAEHDARLVNLSPFDLKDEYASGVGVLRRVSPTSHFLMESEKRSETEEELAKLDQIEAVIAPHGRALLDLYFRIVHPSFPILHKKVFLEKYARTHREFTPLVLAGVYILALGWWTYSSTLGGLPKPNVQDIERMVPRLVGDVIGRPKLASVQGMLLLLQRPNGDSWAMTCKMIAVAQNLGLHLDSTNWKIPEWERSLRKRLGWALYMQDKWASLVNGRPSHITPNNWDLPPVEARDFPETADDEDDQEGSAEVEKGRLVFCSMISLTEILADIQDTFYTVKAIKHEITTLEALEKAKPMQLRLKEWFTSLPMSLSMDETRARKLSSSGYLFLAYFATEITLHRAILRSLDFNATDPSLRRITRTAAAMRLTSAISFVKKLRPEHLQSFWYFASKSNLAIIGTFGSILWITSEDGEECEHYKAQLSDYRWTLRISSQSASFMNHTVAMLDASTVFLRALDPKIGTPKGLLVTASTPQSTDGTSEARLSRDMNNETALPSNRETGETEFSHPASYNYGGGGNGGGGATPVPHDYGMVYNTANSEQSHLSWESSPQNMPTYLTHPQGGVGGGEWQGPAYQYQGFEHMPPHEHFGWGRELEEAAGFEEY